MVLFVYVPQEGPFDTGIAVINALVTLTSTAFTAGSADVPLVKPGIVKLGVLGAKKTRSLANTFTEINKRKTGKNKVIISKLRSRCCFM